MKLKAVVTITCIVFAIFSCKQTVPDPIRYNADHCNNCGMTISNPVFAALLFTKKGRTYKFDDIACLMSFKKDNADKAVGASIYLANFIKSNELIPLEKTFLIKGGTIKSPMGGNTLAFDNQASAQHYATEINAEYVTWNSIDKP